jgi:hypothetical protein
VPSVWFGLVEPSFGVFFLPYRVLELTTVSGNQSSLVLPLTLPHWHREPKSEGSTAGDPDPQRKLAAERKRCGMAWARVALSHRSRLHVGKSKLRHVGTGHWVPCEFLSGPWIVQLSLGPGDAPLLGWTHASSFSCSLPRSCYAPYLWQAYGLRQ